VRTVSEGAASEKPRQADPAIVAKLQDVVALREKMAEMSETLATAGRVPADGSAEVSLAEARIELARERRQSDVVHSELLKIVEVRRNWVKHLEGRITTTTREIDLAEARVALLRAEIQLLREQSKGA
jgi:hypothetical protein